MHRFIRPRQRTAPGNCYAPHAPNILIIILEGFGGEYIEELGGAKNVSPNMSRLIRGASSSTTYMPTVSAPTADWSAR